MLWRQKELLARLLAEACCIHINVSVLLDYYGCAHATLERPPPLATAANLAEARPLAEVIPAPATVPPPPPARSAVSARLVEVSPLLW